MVLLVQGQQFQCSVFTTASELMGLTQEFCVTNKQLTRPKRLNLNGQSQCWRRSWTPYFESLVQNLV
jgi:hypothetical protein